jgi:putative MATE family efflux protein
LSQFLRREDHSNLGRRIRQLAWPAILEMGLHMLVGVVDTAMVGQLGARELAAVALGSRVVFSTIFVFAAVGTGAAALVSRSVGAGDQAEADKVAGQALALAFLLGLVMAAMGYFSAGTLFSLSRTEPPVQHLAADYLRIVSRATLFMLPLFVGNALLRGSGNTRTPLLLALFTNLINIVGDYVLIFGWGQIPALGVAGAAWATAGAQIIGAVLGLILIFSGQLALQVPLKRLLVWDSSLVRRIIRLSVPAALEELVYTISSLAGFFLIGRLGTAALAAHQVAITAESFSYMPGYGFAIAASTLTGQHLGAGDRDGAVQSGFLTARYSLIVMGITGAVFFLFPRVIARGFTSDPNVVQLATICIRIAALEQMPIALEQVIAGSLRGAGDTRYPFLVSLLGNWVLRLPLVALAVVVLELPIWSVWIITVFDFCLRSALLLLRYRGRQWAAIKV